MVWNDCRPDANPVSWPPALAAPDSRPTLGLAPDFSGGDNAKPCTCISVSARPGSPNPFHAAAIMNILTQKGFISLGLTGYLAIGAGVVILALGLAVKVQSARLDAAQQKALALEQQVAQWTAAAKECSDATKKADEEAKKRARTAAIALEAARKGQASSKAEAERLRGLIGSKPATDCPARDGVAEVRKGLK